MTAKLAIPGPVGQRTLAAGFLGGLVGISKTRVPGAFSLREEVTGTWLPYHLREGTAQLWLLLFHEINQHTKGSILPSPCFTF